MPLLALAFLVTALLYASVGFGGGSTYSALLALAGFDYRLLPILSLACNILVVSGSSWRFARAGVTPWRGALGLTALGAPAALLGGLTPIGQTAFLALLGTSLLVTAAAMFVPQRQDDTGEGRRRSWVVWSALPLGYLAGLVGIGGGIFLAPLLHLARWDNARAVAAAASLFILVNSLFGLAGQLLKTGGDAFGQALYGNLPLLLAVVIGGQIGGLLAIRVLPLRAIRWMTAILVAFVGGRLLLGL